MKTKKVYLPDGKEVELLAKYKDGDETKYVVKVAVDEDIYRNELIYENRVVPNVYEKCEDTPTFLYKTKLENEVKRLEKSIKELREQNAKANAEIQRVRGITVEEIAKCLKDEHDKFEALYDYQKVDLPVAGVKLYAQAIHALINQEKK